MEANLNYQNFIKQISKKDFSHDPSEIFGQSDLQQEEGLNIMKDMILLLDDQNTIMGSAIPSNVNLNFTQLCRVA
jgi:carboxyl-terminal processing protease